MIKHRPPVFLARTLGSRLRDFSGSSVATVKRFVEEEKPPEVFCGAVRVGG